jgi:putative flavoprotein involved in K+ transport
MGVLDRTVDHHPEHKSTPNPLFTGVRGGHDIDLHRYVANGVVLLGHVRGASKGRLVLAQDLEEVLALGDEAFVGFKRSVDDFVWRTGDECPEEPAVEPVFDLPTISPSPTELDLERAGVRAVIWATGFRFDFGWVALPVFDAHGQPAQRRGVTRSTGVFFLGLPWMHKLKSSVLCGVGEDAAYLAERIAARHGDC